MVRMKKKQLSTLLNFFFQTLMSVSIGLVKMEELVLIFLETTNVFVQEDSQDHIVKRVSDIIFLK